jgi:hypothetical protein
MLLLSGFLLLLLGLWAAFRLSFSSTPTHLVIRVRPSLRSRLTARKVQRLRVEVARPRLRDAHIRELEIVLGMPVFPAC